MNFITYKDLNNTIIKNIHSLPKDIDLIVGIPRSGLMVASIISLYLNLPLTDLESLIDNKLFENGSTKTNNNWIKNVEQARKILIVEDSSVSGNSIKNLKEKIKNYKYKDKIIILTIYVTKETKNLTDMYFEICKLPRMFEWNYMHHKGIINACFDIDGVLCEDPTEEENDDGEKYIEFIRNAPLRIAPTFPIGCIVTTRLEKYREDTEYWLKKHKIKYEKLIMLNLNSKEERIKSNSRGKFKASVYKKMRNSNIFIESNQEQAMEISKLTGKMVFCVDTQEKFCDSTITKVQNNIKNKIKSILPTSLKKILKKIIYGSK